MEYEAVVASPFVSGEAKLTIGEDASTVYSADISRRYANTQNQLMAIFYEILRKSMK